MIVGVGLDILSVERMARELRDPGPGFRDGVFTPAEIAYCEGKRYPARHFAARFAAKEAVFKALGANSSRLPRWREVEVVSDENGRPGVVLHGKTSGAAQRIHVDTIHVSLTHSAELAAATTILESNRTATTQQEVTE